MLYTFPYMKVKDLADLSLPDIIGLIKLEGVPTLYRDTNKYHQNIFQFLFTLTLSPP